RVLTRIASSSLELERWSTLDRSRLRFPRCSVRSSGSDEELTGRRCSQPRRVLPPTVPASPPPCWPRGSRWPRSEPSTAVPELDQASQTLWMQKQQLERRSPRTLRSSLIHVALVTARCSACCWRAGR